MVKGCVCFFFVCFVCLFLIKENQISQVKKSESENLSVMSDSLQLLDYAVHPGQHTGMGILSLLQGIFPTHGLNPGLPHCRQILYQLSPKGSPRILEWVAYPSSSASS